jgi:oligopeptide/dipeptide ABC transporter ATP-binding protein
MTSAGEAILQVRDLVVDAPSPLGRLKLVTGVSFGVRANEVLCIVGESGSGKSISALAIMGLLPQGVEVAGGQILFQGQELNGLSEARIRRLRGPHLAMVFQDPMTALNPVLRIGPQIAEMIALHRRDLRGRALKAAVVALLTEVNIPNPEARYSAYPHELSGGMRQRVMIAMAMAHRPTVLIADEPTTALDVTIQAQLLDLLGNVRAKTGSAMILITHDLGVVAENADRILIMYAGVAMEAGGVEDIFLRPRHPYTVGLLASLLQGAEGERTAYSIPGQATSAAGRPSGCVFQPRCQMSQDRSICVDVRPVLGGPSRTHTAACHFQDEVADWIDARFAHLQAARGGRARA